MKFYVIFLLLVSLRSFARSGIHFQPNSTSKIRGFCIGAPRSVEHAGFVSFTEKELISGKVNTPALRVDFNYQDPMNREVYATVFDLDEISRIRNLNTFDNAKTDHSKKMDR